MRPAPKIAYVPSMLTPDLCRTARGLLQWTRERLAKEAGLAVTTVTAFELESRQSARTTVAQLRGALEASGVAFVRDSNGETSVVLRR